MVNIGKVALMVHGKSQLNSCIHVLALHAKPRCKNFLLDFEGVVVLLSLLL